MFCCCFGVAVHTLLPQRQGGPPSLHMWVAGVLQDCHGLFRVFRVRCTGFYCLLWSVAGLLWPTNSRTPDEAAKGCRWSFASSGGSSVSHAPTHNSLVPLGIYSTTVPSQYHTPITVFYFVLQSYFPVTARSCTVLLSLLYSMAFPPQFYFPPIVLLSSLQHCVPYRLLCIRYAVFVSSCCLERASCPIASPGVHPLHAKSCFVHSTWDPYKVAMFESVSLGVAAAKLDHLLQC